jgi:hypothetical protein
LGRSRKIQQIDQENSLSETRFFIDGKAYFVVLSKGLSKAKVVRDLSLLQFMLPDTEGGTPMAGTIKVVRSTSRIHWTLNRVWHKLTGRTLF